MYSTRIYYQDTDAGGVVYFANYLRLFEKSWFEYLISLGISLPEWEKMGTYVLIRTAFVDLRERLHYGDIVNITTSIKDVKNAYFVLAHAVSKNGKATTKGEIKMVCVDKNGKPKRLPEDFRSRLLTAVESK
ncbi:MAG: Acyl-CoA thioester hydrolase YbgC [Syntrophorhabdus sp. PtaU1.Bin153]|nr:MAG: Acyl-CoA thioester hydrolase YbgC [Syntrophorhabdus sp. PtaU1.Bin153]